MLLKGVDLGSVKIALDVCRKKKRLITPKNSKPYSFFSPNSAVKRRGGKEEEPALIVVGQENIFVPNTPYPSSADFPIPSNIVSYFELILAYCCLFLVLNLKFTYFSYNYHNHSMFRNVPCSWVYDGLQRLKT